MEYCSCSSCSGFVHDNTIERYTVDLEAHLLTMETRCEGDAGAERVTLRFTGLLAHDFEDVICRNIILDLEELPVNLFLEQERDFLEAHMRFGFPAWEAGSLEQLKAILIEGNYRPFVLCSSMGLSGFVLAQDLRIERNKL